MKNKKVTKLYAMDLNTMNLIIKYLPTNTFTEQRAIICFVLMFISNCGTKELKNFNKLSINELLRNGILTIYAHDESVRVIDIGGFESDLLIGIYPLIDKYYKCLSHEKHILYSSLGEELKNKSAYVWLNNILKEFGKEHNIYLTTKCFRNTYKIRNELLNNLKTKQ